MSKYSFMQTPEQRQRAEYYKKRRAVKSGDMPLLTDAMVQDQPIETMSELTQEMALSDSTFEFATPNMPSSSDVMATFDRGTDGLWADVGADVTGSIMSITQDLYKANAQKKKQKQRLAMKEGQEQLGGIGERLRQEIESNAIARENNQAVASLDIPKRTREIKDEISLEMAKRLFTIENGSQEYSDVVESNAKLIADK